MKAPLLASAFGLWLIGVVLSSCEAEPAPPPAGAVSNGLQLRLEADRTLVSVDESINFTVTWTNQCDRPLPVNPDSVSAMLRQMTDLKPGSVVRSRLVSIPRPTKLWLGMTANDIEMDSVLAPGESFRRSARAEVSRAGHSVLLHFRDGEIDRLLISDGGGIRLRAVFCRQIMDINHALAIYPKPIFVSWNGARMPWAGYASSNDLLLEILDP